MHLQTVLAFYIAKRIIKDVDRSQPLLSKTGIVFLFIMYVLISASFHIFVPKFPRIALQQFIVIISLTLGSALLFLGLLRLSKKRALPAAVSKGNRVIDLLAIFTVIFLVFSFFYFTSKPSLEKVTLLNKDALRVNVIVTPILALIMLVERLRSRKSLLP